MSVNKIIVKGGRKVAMPVTKEEYLNTRASQRVKELLEQVRSGANPKAKLQLPQFNYSGYYPDGVVKGNKLPSKAFVFDIDDRVEFEHVKEALLADPDRYGLLMLERSVNYGGHAVFKRQPGRTILENQVRVATELDCEMDTNAHDINRVLFTTSDSEEDLLYLSDELFEDRCDAAEAKAEAALLEDRERNGMEEVPEGAHRAEKHFRPGTSMEVQKFRSSGVGSTSVADLAVQTNVLGADDAASKLQDSETPLTPSTLDYLGIPYSDLVAKWWDMTNDGLTPVQSNRDVLTYELAVNFRHICGFSRDVLDQIIPCYDGFPYEQKMKCIDSALGASRTQMPRRMRELLDSFRTQQALADNVDTERLSAVLEDQETFVADNLKAVPLGVRESIDAVGPSLAMAAVVAAAACIGTLATGVRLDVHRQRKALNIIGFIVGEFGSGKSAIGPVIDAWMREIKKADRIYLEQEELFRQQKRSAKNKKEQPEESKFPVRYITLNNTVANLAERLANTEGQHAFSYTPEADIVAQKWGSAMGDFSTILREAYDNDEYCREARSADAVNVHIDHVYWNVVMCGTPGALHRVVRNYEDGFQSRVVLATTPDNTYAPLLDEPYQLSDDDAVGIHRVAHLLPLCDGEVELPQLEAAGRAWLERIRMESMKNADDIMARQRFRVCVSTQRIVCCLMLCAMLERLINKLGTVEKAETYLKGCPDAWKNLLAAEQTPEMLGNFALIADTLLETNLYYFKARLDASRREAIADTTEGRQRTSKNDTIYESLPQTFEYNEVLEMARRLRGAYLTRNAVSSILKRWKQSELVTYDESARCYTKVA